MKHIAAVLCILTAAPPLIADDWTEFRGSTGQGHAKGELPLKWSESENVRWKVAIPGAGWSSPVVAKGRIYLTTAIPKNPDADRSDQHLHALCLSAADGKTIWNRELFVQPATKAKKHSKNSHASPTPIFEDGRLYVHFGHQGTACLKADDGSLVWKNRELDYPPVHGSGGSPILVDDKLVFSCDGASNPFVVALSKKSGRVVWKTPRKTEVRKTFSFSTPLLIEVAGAKQVVSPGSGAVVAYDPKGGKEIWRVDYDEGYSVVPRPVSGHGMVFVSSGFDKANAMAIRVDGKGDVTDTHTAWTISKRAPHSPSMLLVGEELYMIADGGTASCVDARTGKVHWQERAGSGISASPIHANGRIYFLDERGKTTVVAADKRKFRVLATNQLDERTLASCAAADGALFIRGEKHLYRIGG